MPVHLQLLAAAVVLHFSMVLAAAVIGARLYTPAGVMWASGARDVPLADATPAIAGRADRAAKNMAENMLFFAPVLLAAHAGGVDPAVLGLGAKIFVGARLVYWPVYLFGIPYLRTLCWVVSLGGIGVILSGMR